ncbi:MAG: hypothetical protein HKN91_17885 [Acidimicrobiia bacterium]|nr:hypothetical protein [Acidimicrobiia bacterium]
MDTFWSPEPIVGYRVWNVFRDRMQGFHSVWREPAFSAQCTLPDAETAAPHIVDGCECGVYAAKDPAWLKSHFAGAVAGPRVALGRVALSGRVVEHTDGFRAQEARVIAIAVRTRHGVTHFTVAADIEALFADPHLALTERGATAPINTDLAELVAS